MINRHRNSGGPRSSSRTPLANSPRSRNADVNRKAAEPYSATSKQRKTIDRNSSAQTRTVGGKEEEESGAFDGGLVASSGTEFRRREAVGSTLPVHSGRPFSVDGRTDFDRRKRNERLFVRIPRMEPAHPSSVDAESTGTGSCTDARLRIKDRSERWIQEWSQEQKPRRRRFTKERSITNVSQYSSSSILTRINKKIIQPSSPSNTGVKNSTRERHGMQLQMQGSRR